jgi:hypothetical protein
VILAFNAEFFSLIMNNDVFVNFQVICNIPVHVKFIVTSECLKVMSVKIVFSWYLFTTTLNCMPGEHNLKISSTEALLVQFCQC